VRIKGRKQLARRIGQIDRYEETVDHWKTGVTPVRTDRPPACR
jgi:hypothetical protein